MGFQGERVRASMQRRATRNDSAGAASALLRSIFRSSTIVVWLCRTGHILVESVETVAFGESGECLESTPNDEWTCVKGLTQTVREGSELAISWPHDCFFAAHSRERACYTKATGDAGQRWFGLNRASS